MKRLMIAVLAVAACCASAPLRAQEPPPCGTKEKPEACASLTTGVVTVMTRGERREYATMGVSFEAPLPAGLSTYLHTDTLGLQDGGSLIGSPQSFRAINLEGGIGKSAGAFLFNLRGGLTYSIEGDVGAPLDPRLYTAQFEARLRLEGDGHIALHGGHDGTVGSWALGGDVVVPVSGGPAIVARLEVPLHAPPGRPRAVVVTAGGRIKVKSFRLRLPRA